MDSLASILRHKDFDEPPEVQAIKKYVQENFRASASVLAREKDIVVVVGSASLVSTLRLRSPEIKRRCDIKKRLVFRIA